MTVRLSRLEEAWLRMLVRECGASAVIGAVQSFAEPIGAESGYETDWCRASIEALSPREREVFTAYVQGKTMKDAAREAGISVNNAKGRLHDAKAKLGIVNRAQACSLARQARLQ